VTRGAGAARGLAAILAIASATYACTIVSGLRVPAPDGPDAAGDAAADAPQGALPDAGDGCRHAFPPPKPAAAGAGGNLEVLVALRTIELRSGAIGYDLDGFCTCGAQGPSCASAQVACDPEGGVDNVAGPLALDGVFSGYDLEKRLNGLIEGGHNTLLLGLQQYNGLPDDDQVTVSVYSAGGVYPSLGDGGFAGEAGAPRWDGDDPWSLDRAQLPTGKPPGSFDTNEAAYVAGGTLVAPVRVKERLNDAFELALTGGVLTAEITMVDGAPQIARGVIAGRWPAVEMVRVFFDLEDPLTGSPVCKDFLVEQVRSSICNAADINANPAADGTAAPCDALSIGMAFTAVPAKFGPVLDVVPAPSPCLDAGVAPACP